MKLMYTYSNEDISLEKFNEAKNRADMKPAGGFYGSPDKDAWLEFCVNGLPDGKCNQVTTIDISKLNILKLETQEDFKKLSEKYLSFEVRKNYGDADKQYKISSHRLGIDFEKLSKDYEAIEISKSLSSFHWPWENIIDIEKIKEASVLVEGYNNELLKIENIQDFIKNNLEYEPENFSLDFNVYDIPTICILNKEGFDKMEVVKKEKVNERDCLKLAGSWEEFNMWTGSNDYDKYIIDEDPEISLKAVVGKLTHNIHICPEKLRNTLRHCNNRSFKDAANFLMDNLDKITFNISKDNKDYVDYVYNNIIPSVTYILDRAGREDPLLDDKIFSKGNEYKNLYESNKLDILKGDLNILDIACERIVTDTKEQQKERYNENTFDH